MAVLVGWPCIVSMLISCLVLSPHHFCRKIIGNEGLTRRSFRGEKNSAADSGPWVTDLWISVYNSGIALTPGSQDNNILWRYVQPLQTVRILNSQTHGPWHAFVIRITFNSLMRNCKTINFTMDHYWWEVPQKMVVWLALETLPWGSWLTPYHLQWNDMLY